MIAKVALLLNNIIAQQLISGTNSGFDMGCKNLFKYSTTIAFNISELCNKMASYELLPYISIILWLCSFPNYHLETTLRKT